MTTATNTREPNSGTATAAADQAPPQPVSGLLDITRRGPAFLRTSGFRTGPADVSVPASLIRQYDLRPGDLVTGTARPASPARNRNGNGNRNGQAKSSNQARASAQQARSSNQTGNPTLATVATVNGTPAPAQTAAARPHFDRLTPVYADERIRLEAGSD